MAFRAAGRRSRRAAPQSSSESPASASPRRPGGSLFSHCCQACWILSTLSICARSRCGSMAIFSSRFQSPADSAGYPQPAETVAGHEAAIDQPAHLRLNIRQPQRHAHVDAPFQPLIDVKHRGQNLFDLFGYLHHGLIQFGAHLIVQFREILLAPHRAARLIDKFIDATGDTVINQISTLP